MLKITPQYDESIRSRSKWIDQVTQYAFPDVRLDIMKRVRRIKAIHVDSWTIMITNDPIGEAIRARYKEEWLSIFQEISNEMDNISDMVIQNYNIQYGGWPTLITLLYVLPYQIMPYIDSVTKLDIKLDIPNADRYMIVDLLDMFDIEYIQEKRCCIM